MPACLYADLAADLVMLEPMSSMALGGSYSVTVSVAKD